MKNLTAADRDSLIRLAASLPKGDESRRAILAGLKTAAPEIKPELHPILSGGVSGFADFGESIYSAFKGSVKSPKNVLVRRKTGPNLYRMSMRVLPLDSFEVVFDILVEYDFRTFPQVHLKFSGREIIIPSSTGLNPDGTLGMNVTDPGKLISFLIGFVRDNSVGFNIMKGDDANPNTILKDKHDLIKSVFSSFKKLAKAAGAPIDAVTSRDYIERPTSSKDGLVWSLGSEFPRDPSTVETALKVWNVVTSKFSSKLGQSGIIPRYVPPRPSVVGIGGIGTFILEIV